MIDIETREIALMILGDCGGCLAEAARQTGISTASLARWRARAAEGGLGRKPRVNFTGEDRIALARRCAAGEDPEALARESGAAAATIESWRRAYFRGGSAALAGKRRTGRPEAPPPRDGGMPPETEAELRRRIYELELDNAILAGTIEILKKDPGADASSLTNGERATLAGALREKFRLNDVLARLSLARSTYYYQLAAMRRPDKYARLRARVRSLFGAHRGTWGSERIWAELRRPADGAEPVFVSEKVVRRVMREEGLRVVYDRRKRTYSSYRGEISGHPGNRVNRDFGASRPNELWLTDITQFALPSFKCYLSPVIDCFDGLVVAHRVSRSPNAELVNSMLADAISTLAPGEHPVVHTDCGCHYRWDGWIEACERGGLVRSMSAKGRSGDNAACEGFFGRLKNEMFYYRNWKGVTFEEFSEAIDAYVRDYNERRIKKSLGWLSPIEYRRKLGLVA